MESTTYQVIDTKTQQVLSTHKDRIQARRKRDRLDMQYGAVRYVVKPVFAEESGRLEFAPGIKNGTQLQVVEADRTVRWVGVLWDVAA